MNKLTVMMIGLAAGSTACVSKARYDAVLKNANGARVECDRATSELQTLASTERGQINELGAKLQAADARLKATDGHEKELLRVVDDEKVLADTLRRELERKGENEALYKDLAIRLKSAVETGDLSIVVRGGRMVLRLPNDVLFDSGSAELKPAGKRTLAYVASVLSTVPGRKFQVAGHTDSTPMQSARFPSNWELSTARAIQVVHFLVVNGGLKPTLLSAAGYGEFDPVLPNVTPADRARNRRIEITLQPDIKELVAVPDRY